MFRKFGLAALAFSACASPAVAPEIPMTSLTGVWTLEAAVSGIREASCPKEATAHPPEKIALKAEPIELGGTLKGFSYVGGWHLTSDDARFGGLSGLEMLASGNMLAVSDQGYFVELIPQGDSWAEHANMWAMRGDDGKWLDGKAATDAEGLVVRGGIALVSFEREHRILGFAIETCGQSARGVEIAALPGEQVGKAIDPNKGAEALSLSANGEITFGYETGPASGAPLGTVFADGRADFTSDANAPFGYAQVGRDEADGVVAELFRSYDPIRGNRNVIRIGDLDARIVRPMAVDNYEGITLQQLPDGKMRIWIISDDNFNPRQRTLLMGFDVD